MRRWWIALAALVAASLPVAAQEHHHPLNQSPTLVYSDPLNHEYSEAAWDSINQRWLALGDEQYIHVFDASFNLIAVSPFLTGTADTEGLALAPPRGDSSRYMYVLDEVQNVEKVHQYDYQAWVDAGYAGAPTLTKTWSLNLPNEGAQGAEGLAFIKLDSTYCNELTQCEDGGIFLASDQVLTSGQLSAFYLDADSTGVQFIARPAEGNVTLVGDPTLTAVPCGVIGNEHNSIDYEPNTKNLAYISQGPREMCIASPPVCSNDANRVCFANSQCQSGGTCTPVQAYGNYDSGTAQGGLMTGFVEGIGLCHGCGVVVVTVDGATGTQIWTYEDDYCGDDFAISVDTCDGTDLKGQSCGSQGQGSGTLACNTTCDGFVYTGCTGPGARRVIIISKGDTGNSDVAEGWQ